MSPREVFGLFRRAHVDGSIARKMVKEHGRDCLSLLKHDPYTMLYTHASLEQVDRIATLLQYTKEKVVLGHVYWLILAKPQAITTLKMRVQTSLAIPRAEMDRIIDGFLTSEKIVSMGKYAVHPKQYGMVRDVVNDILTRVDWGQCPHPDMEEAFQHIECTEEQRYGLSLVCQNKVSVITGGPGCGKSYLVRNMVQHFTNARVTAPTGRAARNAKGKTVHYFKTIQETSKNELRDTELVIVDEASMLSAPLCHAVLSMCSPKAHIVFVGDPDQLPPIDMGYVLRDVLESTVVPRCTLTHNHRSIQPLHEFCRHIRDLSHIDTIPDAVEFIECHTMDDVLNALPRVSEHIILTPHNADRIQINAVVQLVRRQGQVLDVTCTKDSPETTRGASGTLRPMDGAVEFNGSQYPYSWCPRHVTLASGVQTERGVRVLSGDTIIITKNTGDVCNGDLGTYIVGGGIVNGCPVTLPEDDKDPGYTLGYCVTVHKSQGSEFDTVVLPLTNVSAWTRTLLYTAATRAKDKIIMLGTRSDLNSILHQTRPPPPKFLLSMLSGTTTV